MAEQVIRMHADGHIFEITDAGTEQRGVTSVYICVVDKTSGITQSVIRTPMSELIAFAHLIIKQYGLRD
jgi:hypothetical protein